jgi:hypothetical protein
MRKYDGASPPFTHLLAYNNHLYGDQQKAFEVSIAEQEAIFQPRKLGFLPSEYYQNGREQACIHKRQVASEL